MWKTTAAVLLSATCVLAIRPTPASAKELEPVPFIAPWGGGAFANDQTGQFTSCIASANYRSGITMTVLISRGMTWALGFSDPAWNLQVGQDIPLAMMFDGQAPWSGLAHVYNEHMAVVPMAENSVLINSFRGAYQMQVTTGAGAFRFNLGGTSRLMVQLAQCVETQLAVERGEPRPNFAAAPPQRLNPAPGLATATTAPSAAQLELAATRIATNLLLQADLPHARLLSETETPPTLHGRGAAWTSDVGLGAVELVPGGTARNANEVGSQLVASDSAACKGDFASGRSSELLDDKVITKAFTGCKDSTGTRGYRYFIVRASSGDFIVFALTGAAASSQANNSPLADNRFQSAVVKAAFSP